ncbi:RNA polymerase II subunit A C-terminal domain phosphatase [Phytophthora boehmeriae]|uniref:RNA polymerase II subunit A C-terminal domain phosphatase SSU72 n=1 Tax=Phytophthora boehmeriae TaxID=109152 RepID=A0A8T1WQW0_9STRA|nr:RNA polymerase II subunit A C-terminal domain phosphatase [Phytophthora boehmeriae]
MAPTKERPMFAMLCANNVNRSTEAHDHLHAAGLRVCSFGAGNRVRFPGPSRDDPRIYEFFTPYETMYKELKAENAELFKRNGVLSMLERDMLTKKCPQRWQDLSVKELQGLDVVLCFDDRIFHIVLEDLQLRGAAGGPGGPGNDPTMLWRPLHLLCLDTKDTPEHAKVGGSLALELCQAIDTLDDLDGGIINAVQDFESRRNVHLLYSLLHV